MIQSSVIHSVDSWNTNCTNGYTEPYLSQEVLWEVVQQQSNAGSDILPVWDCKIAKQMKLQEAAAVPVFQKLKNQNKFAFGFIPLSPLVREKHWEDNGKTHSPIEAYHS